MSETLRNAKSYAVCILLLFVGVKAMGQNRDYKIRAEKAFAEKDYETAAYYYEQSLENSSVTTAGKVPYFSARQPADSTRMADIRYQLAECYRLANNFLKAESLYKEVIESDEFHYPMARLWYGRCLRCNNKLDEAVSQLELFISSNEGNENNLVWGNNELKNSLFAKQQMATTTTTRVVKLADSFSVQENDFAGSIAAGKLWFTGTSAAAKIKNRNSIFTTEKAAPVKDPGPDFFADGKFQFGSQSLDSAGTTMYLTRWYKDKGARIAAIFITKYEAKTWSVPLRLNSFVNADGYYAMQPFVTPDGKRLFYASNRKGGQGGSDIWMSDLDAGGMPVNAVNLGNSINTAADEGTPFYHARTGRLVFSSNGYVGMGNFDLYESKVGKDGSWLAPRNMGYPYNSTKDDLYYFIDDSKDGLAYLSSDRESDCCLNLFEVHVAKPVQVAAPKLFVLSGRVLDCETEATLAGVSVELVDELTKKTQASLTGEKGGYEFTLDFKRRYQIKLQKEGYFSKVVSLSAIDSVQNDTLQHADICLLMFKVNQPIVIKNILYDFNKAVLKPESKLVLEDLVSVMNDNPKITIELSAHTDAMGPDWYNTKLSQQRAQACVDYIVSRGIPVSRISAKGYGESKPIEPNTFPDGRDNKEGRRLNRRTEFMVLSL